MLNPAGVAAMPPKPQLPPQPPPELVLPEISQAEFLSRHRFWGLVIFGTFSVLFVLLSLPSYLHPGPKPNPELDEAARNLGWIGHALFLFQGSYESCPSAITAIKVKEKTLTPLSLGNGSANELFRQLLATGDCEEKYFYAAMPGMRRPDGDFSTDATALEPGECAFAYIYGASGHAGPAAPVAVAPLLHGTTSFDPRPFHGMAAVLRLDGAVSCLPIDASGHVVENGKDLFDPEQPYWDEGKPEIHWQE